MSKDTRSREKKLTQLDDTMLQAVQQSGFEWQSRHQIRKFIEKDLASHHLASLKRLEQLGFIEIRQGKSRQGGLRFEYRAKDQG